MGASNMSIQPGLSVDSPGYKRPSMKIDRHPEHNMPPSEHDGYEMKYPNKIKSLTDAEIDANEKRRPNSDAGYGGEMQ